MLRKPFHEGEDFEVRIISLKWALIFYFLQIFSNWVRRYKQNYLRAKFHDDWLIFTRVIKWELLRVVAIHTW